MFSTASILVLTNDTPLSKVISELKRRGIRAITEEELHVQSRWVMVCEGAKANSSNTLRLNLDVYSQRGLKRRRIVPAGTMVPFKHNVPRTRRVPDHTVASLRPLTSKDWESIKAAITPKYRDDPLPTVIDSLRMHRNKPVPVHKAFDRMRNTAIYGRPGTTVAGMNTTLRQKKLPYRIKITDLPASQKQEDRLIQVLMMPSQNGSTSAR